MRIPCPHCGPRDYSEFRYGGDATKQRPAHGAGDLNSMHDYYFLFDNPKGPHTEYWQHVLGCRQWFKLNRNTATNHIIPSPLAGEGDAKATDEGGAASSNLAANPLSVSRKKDARSTFSRKGRGEGAMP